MKLLDPVEGIKVVASCIAFQFVFATALLSVLIKYWRMEPLVHYPTTNKEGEALTVSGQDMANQMEWIAIELLIGHIVVGVLWVIPSLLARCLKNNPWWVAKKILSVLSVGVYMRAMFIACSQYPQVKQQMVLTESGMELVEPLQSL